ncbi:MAG: SDR family oxidoreductase [Alphaproteobacteria bacterium]|nr:SDR family oxidoreductase [Alphaproteobacteria bacterium]
MNLKGKTALVTGGASGIGKATVNALAAAGARVFVADIDEKGGKAAEAEGKAAGRSIEWLRLDLGDGASVDACAKEALAKAGRVDILINAAGWDRIQPFIENSPEFQDKVLAINLGGPLRLTRALLPKMAEGGGGRIVNVASDAGRVGSMGETVYAAAKGGLIAFTKSLAREMARYKITVNCVCPGPTDTPLFHAQPEKLKEALTKAIPFRRIGKPEEVAGAILYFANPESDYTTAQIISVSGGLTMAG